jgi:arylsulfatase A-like enzyme
MATTDGSTLPFPTAPSASTAGYTLAESTHQRRVEPRHLPDDAPNILIVLLDDVGFGLSDVVGGEVRTPAFRRVAENGICYNTFHTTSICSPTRAALLTGRNHHRVHSGTIAERAVDWDGYTGVIGKDTATVAEVLQHYGYCTAAFGKWHNSPATQTTAMGPFDRWPTGHGFDYFYGFIAGETSQWEPRLYQNLNPIEPPEREGYHLSEDLADNAISWLRQHRAYAPDRPFFMYWAPGAAHGPHHVAKEWADKYTGAFDDGWDAYRERVFARQKDTGWIPAEAELAWAGNTPFHHTKLVASHFGGTRNPMAISWPRRITPDGAMRGQFHHVNDITPTIYEILGITAPQCVEGHEQKPLDGISLAYTFDHADDPGRKAVQYFENAASRGIYQDGWYACAFGPFVPWDTASTAARMAAWNAETEPWELYYLPDDFSQANDLAADQPEKLAALKELFKEVSRDSLVWPVGAGLWLRSHPEDRISSPYTRWRFDTACTRMPEFTAPGLGRQDSRVDVALTMPDNASGVLYALGGFSGGLTLFLDNGYLVYEYNMLIVDRYQARSTGPISGGSHVITVTTRFDSPAPMGPATVTLNVDGTEVASVAVARTVPAAFTASETFGVGVDLGSPVSPDYFDRRPFRFTGTIDYVDVEVFPPGTGA